MSGVMEPPGAAASCGIVAPVGVPLYFFRAFTTRGDTPVATIEMRFLLGADYVSEKFLAGRPRHGWIEVDVRGTPGSRLTHETYMEQDVIGTWSTGTRALNAIPFVCAKPGLLSPLDLPLARMIRLRE